MDILFDKNALLSGIRSEALELEKIASESAAQQSKDLLYNSYESIIEQYYLYKTTSYYRHNTGIGTCTGDNLYQSNEIDLLYAGDRASGLELDINSSRMAGYPRISKDIVLDNVLNGIRGVPNTNPSWLINKKTNRHMMMFQRETSFEAVIKTKFGDFAGTPREIMTQLAKKIEGKYYETFWDQAWRNAVKSGRYQFFKSNGKFIL